MAFETELVTNLQTIAGLSTKVFPLTSPEDVAVPYLVYHKTRGDDPRTLGGYNAGLTHSFYQLDIYHSTYKQLKTLSGSVVAALKALNGQTLTTIKLQEIIVSEAVEMYEANVYLYRSAIEIEVYY